MCLRRLRRHRRAHRVADGLLGGGGRRRRWRLGRRRGGGVAGLAAAAGLVGVKAGAAGAAGSTARSCLTTSLNSETPSDVEPSSAASTCAAAALAIGTPMNLSAPKVSSMVIWPSWSPSNCACAFATAGGMPVARAIASVTASTPVAHDAGAGSGAGDGTGSSSKSSSYSSISLHGLRTRFDRGLSEWSGRCAQVR